MKWLKEKWISVLLISFLLGEFIFSKDWFFIQVLFYVLIIKVLLEAKIAKDLLVYLQMAIWGTFISAFGLAIYGNYFLNSGHTPDWLEFLRSSEGVAIGMGLLFAGIVISYKDRKLE